MRERPKDFYFCPDKKEEQRRATSNVSQQLTTQLHIFLLVNGNKQSIHLVSFTSISCRKVKDGLWKIRSKAEKGPREASLP